MIILILTINSAYIMLIRENMVVSFVGYQLPLSLCFYVVQDTPSQVLIRNTIVPVTVSMKNMIVKCVANHGEYSSMTLVIRKKRVATVFCQIHAPCTLTDTLMNSEGPKEYSRVFSAIFPHFGQFSIILREIFHQKVVGAHLFKQAHLFGKIWYVLVMQENIVASGDQTSKNMTDMLCQCGTI